MRFVGRIFATLVAARAARDGHFAGGEVWTLTHDEGALARDFRNPRPGRAAARLRGGGVTTKRAPIILRNLAGTAFACPQADGKTLSGASVIRSGFDDGDETT